MKRRPKLTIDILTLLKRGTGLTQAQISQQLKAKPHSVRAVLWKLVGQGKISATKSAKAATIPGPKVVNVYCSVEGFA